MNCDLCGKVSARVHITTVEEGGVSNVRHLCEECARQTSDVAGTTEWREKVRRQNCDWCGKPATGGGHGPGWERFYCTDCGQEWGAILRGVYENFPKPSNPKLVSDWTARAMQEADGTMRRRIRRRR